jgi:hypothetical protein
MRVDTARKPGDVVDDDDDQLSAVLAMLAQSRCIGLALIAVTQSRTAALSSSSEKKRRWRSRPSR